MTNQMTIFDLTMPTIKIDKPIRLIELFAGIGSQAMALRDLNADFEHYRVIEVDPFAIDAYNAIHGTNFDPTDITKISGAALGIKDTDDYCYILTYSFPCQDLSLAGQKKGMKKGSQTRSGLLWEVERLLDELDELPQVLLMENVAAILNQNNVADFHEWQKFLAKKGYTNYTQILNGKDYGVAQSRERCFMVSVLGEYNYKFPKPISLDKCMADYLEEQVDESYYINSEKAMNLIQKLLDNGIISPDDSAEQSRAGGLSTLTEHLMECTSSKEPKIEELGFIEHGTGKHQSNSVFSKNGLMRTQYSLQHKNPTMVVDK